MQIHHVALRTKRVGALVQFYTAVMELPVVRRDDVRGSVWLAMGDATLMIERADPSEPDVPAGTMDLLAFTVADEAARERFRARVSVEAETAFTLYFRDPDGRRVAVSHYALR